AHTSGDEGDQEAADDSEQGQAGHPPLRAPEGPYETLAGLVAAELGRIPETGDGVEVAGWRLDVVDASGRRAARVLLHAPLADETEQEGQR
ncbi:transporter associated domain-containing protein, partial [Streptomyces hyaluromycini]